MNKLIDFMAKEIMEQAQYHSENKPEFYIELFDSWIDCKLLAQTAYDAFVNYDFGKENCPTCGEHHENTPIECETGDGI